MRVDLLKLIQYLLLPSLRKPKAVEFIRSLVSQATEAHNDFELSGYDRMYRANANASVISLEHHIKREFDARAVITNLDGKPTDFLVTVDGNVDEARLRALIDRYKLAGRSYVFKIQDVTFTSKFVDYVCENMKVAYTSKFVDHVCEIIPINEITVFYRSSGTQFFIEASLQYPAASELRLVAHIRHEEPDHQGETTFLPVEVWVEAGSASARSDTVDTADWYWNDGIAAVDIQMESGEKYDGTYWYKVINQKEY
jgi:hypothetical protein